ncbi:hypothetical protein T265_10011 [Opisthorchis viverrini]|uniref:Uncharacterized protein n=1 Tax=Opisthorchis viverrini TaxID=6198 RepID=A0A074Z3W4_OPIVI|nr:hypothetical protein T265_10011 [Opisthorchis viverrini]KER21733.1 hypothetical protein T265_10011 [Opisthorchis viverrini]
MLPFMKDYELVQTKELSNRGHPASFIDLNAMCWERIRSPTTPENRITPVYYQSGPDSVVSCSSKLRVVLNSEACNRRVLDQIEPKIKLCCTRIVQQLQGTNGEEAKCTALGSIFANSREKTIIERLTADRATHIHKHEVGINRKSNSALSQSGTNSVSAAFFWSSRRVDRSLNQRGSRARIPYSKRKGWSMKSNAVLLI